MEKEYINIEQSLALKELGFDEPCFGYYSNGNLVYGNHTNNMMQRFRYSAPTFSQVFRWFREKYDLHSEILLDQTTQPKYCFEIHKYEDFGNYEEIRIGEWFLYRTYEEAELACLVKLIEIVKNSK